MREDHFAYAAEIALTVTYHTHSQYALYVVENWCNDSGKG